MLASIILHNIIVEEEYVEDEDAENSDDDMQNPARAFQVYDGPVDAQGRRIPFEPMSRDGSNIQRFHDRVSDLESVYIHTKL